MTDELQPFELGDIGLEGADFDLGSFDLAGFDMGQQLARIDNRYVKPPLYVGARRAPVMYEHAATMARELGPAIMEGERIFAVVSGNFIFGDFLEAFAVEQNVLIDHMSISTLALSQENVDSLHNLMAGDYVHKLDIIVSDYWYAHNRRNVSYVHEQLDMGDRFQLAVAGIHTKIVLMKIGERKIVMHGSANLRSSRSVESFMIETDEALYDFNAAWHGDIIEHYATIRKAPRAGALYDIIMGGNDGERK